MYNWWKAHAAEYYERLVRSVATKNALNHKQTLVDTFSASAKGSGTEKADVQKNLKRKGSSNVVASDSFKRSKTQVGHPTWLEAVEKADVQTEFINVDTKWALRARRLLHADDAISRQNLSNFLCNLDDEIPDWEVLSDQFLAIYIVARHARAIFKRLMLESADGQSDSELLVFLICL